jgi:hypothetical protein
MTRKTLGIFTAALFAVALCWAAPANADDHGEPTTRPADDSAMSHDSHAGMGEMSPEEAAMHEAWAAVATPGPEHEAMAAAAGEWEGTMKMKMAADQPEWLTSEFTASIQPMFDGRYMEETFHGSMMGMPFEGRSFSGYDRASGEYFSIWMDNMNTAPGVIRGKMKDDGSIVMKGRMHDVAVGHEIGVKGIVKHHDADSYSFSMYFEGANGDWWHGMEMEYRRVK